MSYLILSVTFVTEPPELEVGWIFDLPVTSYDVDSSIGGARELSKLMDEYVQPQEIKPYLKIVLDLDQFVLLDQIIPVALRTATRRTMMRR